MTTKAFSACLASEWARRRLPLLALLTTPPSSPHTPPPEAHTGAPAAGDGGLGLFVPVLLRWQAARFEMMPPRPPSTLTRHLIIRTLLHLHFLLLPQAQNGRGSLSPRHDRPMKRSLAAATTQSVSSSPRRRRATLPCLRSLLASTFMVAAVVLTHTATVAEAGVLGGKKGAVPVAAATKVKATSPIPPPKSTPPSKLRYVGAVVGWAGGGAPCCSSGRGM